MADLSVHFSSDTAEWSTPTDFYEVVRRQFSFAVDAAATARNSKCVIYYDKKTDALSLPVGRWVSQAAREGGHVWCNPPYGRTLAKWCERFYLESTKAKRAHVVALLPARTDTKWFHDWCKYGDTYLLRGRLHFNDANNGAPFPSMLVVFRPQTVFTPTPVIRTWDWANETIDLI